MYTKYIHRDIISPLDFLHERFFALLGATKEGRKGKKKVAVIHGISPPLNNWMLSPRWPFIFFIDLLHSGVLCAVYTVWIFICICMSLKVFLFAKKMKFLTKGGIHSISQVMPFFLLLFPFILDIKFVGRTHRISHPPSFYGACLNFPREKDSAFPFPRLPLSRILCTNDLIILHRWAFLFIFFSEKNPVCRDRTHVPTCQEGYEVPLSYRGDRLPLALLFYAQALIGRTDGA